MGSVARYSDEVPELAPEPDGIEVGAYASQLPVPVGYKILLMLAEVEETTEGGIALPQERRDAEQEAAIVGYVLAMGPDAYADKSRYKGDPWCKEGDWVLFKPYSGQMFTVHGKQFRVINEDTVECTVEDPRGLGRA